MSSDQATHPAPSTLLALILAWLAVGLPLAWGVAMTISRALALFR